MLMPFWCRAGFELRLFVTSIGIVGTQCRYALPWAGTFRPYRAKPAPNILKNEATRVSLRSRVRLTKLLVDYFLPAA